MKGQLVIKAGHRMQKKKKKLSYYDESFFLSRECKERTYLSSNIREFLDHSIMHQKAP